LAGTVFAEFLPGAVYLNRNNFLIIKTLLDTYYGHWNGWVVDGNGKKIEFSNILGYIEIMHAKW
jgi:hypothetical protein